MTQEPKLFPYITRLLQGASVEWKPLGEVTELITTGKLNANAMEENGIYPFFTCNENPYKINTYAFDMEAILISGNGSQVGHINFYKGKFNAYQRTYILGNFVNQILSKFVYYYLKSELRNYIITNSKKGSVPYITLPMLEKFQIPLPPISVQQEIVRILDKFTTLETELETELDCRKRQYEYYRNHLLTFGDEVEWKALGEVVKTTKNIKWQNNENAYDYIDLTSVCRETGNVLETLKIKADNAPSRAQKMVQLDDVIFATTRPSQMRIALIPKKFDGQIASTGYCVLRADKVNVLPKWIFFTLSTTEFKKFVAENQSGTAYPAISDSKLKEFKIPLPPLSEQQRIATILDKFDTLVNSISEGLPREIELRKKQYEYYREQLLSFPKT